MKREAKHVRRELTPQEQARVNEARRLIATEEPEIRRQAKVYKAAHDESRQSLQNALQALKAERIRQGLSLSDVQERTGIEPPNLSRLENDVESNPTVNTLTRYAEALGKKLLIVVADA